MAPLTAGLRRNADIESSELGTAAGRIAGHQEELAAEFALLADRLGLATGMAGDDAPGASFAAAYTPAADAAFAGLSSAVRVLGGATAAMVSTGNNYARAEALAFGGIPALLTLPPTAAPTDRSPPPAAGAGSAIPLDLLRSYWPTAHPHLLLEAASTWRSAADGVAGAVRGIGYTIATLESGNSGPDVEAMVEFWADLVGPGHTLFGELEALCGQIAALCDGYGRLVEDTHGAIREGIAIMIATGALLAVTGVGLALAAHVGLAEIELLLNPAADAFAARLPGTLTAVDPGLVDSLARLAAGLATPVAVEAELMELEDATDAGLGGTAIPMTVAVGTPRPVPRFAATTFPSVDLTDDHVTRHAADFGLTTEEDYVDAAREFLRRAQEMGLPGMIDSRGIVRVHDPMTNTVATYDSATGQIGTFFRPTSPTYWDRNSGDWGSPVRWE